MEKGTVIFLIVVVLPLLIFLWHKLKSDGNRPDGYKPIQDRPVIPAVVIDITMPFPSMVVFIFKLALASIPAIMLLILVLMSMLGAIFGFTLPGH